jgi:sec-independent protein translocase protein TatA
MGGLSWWHWLIILAAFILLFGAKRLPDAARGVGRSLRILKSEVAAMDADDPPATTTTAPAAAGTATPVAAVTAVPEPPVGQLARPARMVQPR